MAKRRKRTTNVADQIAEFIGRSMGELLNRKESLQRQLAEVESQIVDVGHHVSRQFDQFAPKPKKRRGRRTGVKGVADRAVVRAQKAKRAVSPETRRKMAEAARKRWAAIKKAAKD